MTVPYPNLGPARLAVERLLADTATVQRDAAGAHDDVLNETTGALTQPFADSSVVWTGPCLVTPQSNREAPQWDGALAVTPSPRGDYRGLIPLAAPPLLAGDELTVNTSARDPHLSGRTFRVVEVGELSTFAVVRIVGLELL